MKIFTSLKTVCFMVEETTVEKPMLSWGIFSIAILTSFLVGLLLTSVIERRGDSPNSHINKKNGTFGLKARIDTWGPNHLRLYQTPELDLKNGTSDTPSGDSRKPIATTALMAGYEIIRAGIAGTGVQTADPQQEVPLVEKLEGDLPTIIPPVFQPDKEEQAVAAQPVNTTKIDPEVAELSIQ